MNPDENIFKLFQREDFKYRSGDDEARKEYTDEWQIWGDWCKELVHKVDKFDEPVINNWQNSGWLSKYFWARAKFVPFKNSASCISFNAYKGDFRIQLSYEMKNEDSVLSIEEYNKLILENLKRWIDENDVDTHSFYICRQERNRDEISGITLNEYLENNEKRDLFSDINDIVIDIGCIFTPNEISKLDAESDELIGILEKLANLYERVQKPNEIYNRLKSAKELEPDEHDGSYELVRETVRAFKAVPYDTLDIDDLDAMFFMSVGSWKRGVPSKKELIDASHLPQNEKDRLKALLDEVEEKTKNGMYNNKYGKPGYTGMFGSGFMTFHRGAADDESAKKFIKLCTDISGMTDDEEMFKAADKTFSSGIKGLAAGSASAFLHCLKPFTFPIINGKEGEGTTNYDALGIVLNSPSKLKTYIGNAIKIKKYRDTYFSFKNYRLFDIADKEIKQGMRYWLGGATYDSGDMSQKFKDNNVFAIGWFDRDLKDVLHDREKLKEVYKQNDIDKKEQNIIDMFLSIKAGDKIAIKSTFAKGKTSILRIKAIGTVQKDAIDGYVYNNELIHTIPVKWENIEQTDYDNIGGYWSTLNEVKYEEDIRKIFLNEAPKEQSYSENDKIPQELPNESYSKEQFLQDAYISEDKYNKITRLLKKKKNIILQGAPGVGKSYLAKKIAYSVMGKKDDSRVKMIQFHQSYSYEDFIMGYRPNDKGGYDLTYGVFYKFCRKAIDNPNEDYYFIIDEINRGNLSKIFGELMLLIEADKRGKGFEMPTVYSSEKFYIPKNLYIIGLMNTADRSIALLDYALRRRFSFVSIEPAFESENFKKYISGFRSTHLQKLIDVVCRINDDIENDESLGRGFKIGHSYFCNLESANDDELRDIIECDIIPLIEEYWFDNTEKVKNWVDALNEALS